MSLFLTGTDTGVGKTHTATRLLRLARASGLRCAGLKPICCGDRQDAEHLLAASSEGLTIDQVNPVWLKTPIAPFSASLIEGVEINTPQLLSHLAEVQQSFDFVVVEGVGGWLVPIRREYCVGDLAAEMKLPVVVVALNRLGCLNHTLLTVQSITGQGVTCAGVALQTVNGIADLASTTNEEVLRKLLGVPLLPELGDDLTALPAEWNRLLAR